MKNWGVLDGIAAAVAAGIYVIWGPITERKKRRKGKKHQTTVSTAIVLTLVLIVPKQNREVWGISHAFNFGKTTFISNIVCLLFL